MQQPSTRRRFLRSTALAGLVSTVGCLSGLPGDDPSTPGETATRTPTATPTPTETDTTTPARTSTDAVTRASEIAPPASLDAWLADANGSDGEVIRIGTDRRPSVRVGEPTESGPAFWPPAIEVAPMTTVRWEWTGHGEHNVVALDGTFDSGRTNAQPGTGYHYIFDEPGEYFYVSEPHYDEGMRGVVVVSEPPESGNRKLDRWLADAGNFDGTVVDRTDQAEVTVTVGASGNGGAFAFDPPAVMVTGNTTVVWEWTGDGGAHTVDFEDVDVDSGDPRSAPGATFEHTFESPGTFLYACDPHRALGMKGAVEVVE